MIYSPLELLKVLVNSGIDVSAASSHALSMESQQWEHPVYDILPDYIIFIVEFPSGGGGGGGGGLGDE